jgi:hypothetical protein
VKPWMTGPKPEVVPSKCASLTLVQPVAVHPHIESVSKLLCYYFDIDKRYIGREVSHIRFRPVFGVKSGLFRRDWIQREAVCVCISYSQRKCTQKEPRHFRL